MMQYITIPAPATGGGFDLTLQQSQTRSVYLSSSAVFTATTDTAGVTLTNAEWYEDNVYIGSGLTLPYTASNLLGDRPIKCIASDGTSAASGSFTHEVVGVIYDHIRPDWPDIDSLVSEGDEKIVIQTAVFDTGSNYLHFRCAGDFDVNWGDGTSNSYSANAEAGRIYSASALPASSASSEGYKVATCTITPQAGQQLTEFLMGVTTVTTATPNPGLDGMAINALDIRMAGTNFTKLRVEGESRARRTMLERFVFVGNMGTLDGSTNFAFNQNRACKFFRYPSPNASYTGDSHFNNNNALLACTIGDTDFRQDLSLCTSAQNMFNGNHSMLHADGPSGSLSGSSCTTVRGTFGNCSNLVNVGNMEFPNATTAFDMFMGCRSLRKIGNQTIDSATGTANSDGIFDFTNVANTVTTFENCHSLADKMFPTNLTFPAATQADGMFTACSSFRDFRPHPDLVSEAVDTNAMFKGCNDMHTLGPLNVGKSQNVQNMFNNCIGLKTLESMSFQSVTSADLMFNLAECLTDMPHFNFTAATDLADTFESSDFTNTIQTPVSISMHQNTTCDDLFKTVGRVKAIYITGSNNVTNWNEAFSGCRELTKLEADMSYTGATFTSTFVNCDALNVVDIPGISNNVDFSSCHGMTKEVLDGIFESLATVTGKTIDVSGTVGASTCDTSIATDKGWTVTTS
jgi:hypothetical protein